jgi:SAM-dependent methyltransferase
MAAAVAIDNSRLHQLMEKALNDMGASIGAPLMVIGERLGLFKTLAKSGPLTSADLASRTHTSERYVREWLNAQAAAGYIQYDPQARQYYMTPEQALVLAGENGPAYLPGFYLAAVSASRDLDKVLDAFRTGEGVGWHEHDHLLFEGTEKFFKPGYVANLVTSWLPALDGVVARLEKGARVADVGCGHGASTILMAQTYPNSEFFGFDYHSGSIERARHLAREAGVADRITFEVASSKAFPGNDYDLVAFFDCLHDMGDPAGAAKHVRASLAGTGVWMIVEPFANDRIEENLNPVGRVFYAASTMICTPASLSQEVGLALGAQAGEARIREVVTAGGFSRFRRATETPFNLVFEARP